MIVASVLLTLIYIVYILLYFIGVGFITISIMEYIGEEQKIKNDTLTQLKHFVLFISLFIVCFTGVYPISIDTIINKIKILW